MSKNKVEFFRYHRPVDLKTGLPRSDMGVTLFVKMNYKKRWIRVSASICNGDNFSKDTGKLIAKDGYDWVNFLEFDLDDFQISEMGITDYVKTMLENSHDDEFFARQAILKQLRMRGK